MDNEKLIKKMRSEINNMNQEERENKHAICKGNLDLLNYFSVILWIAGLMVSVSAKSFDIAIVIVVILTVLSIPYRKKTVVMISLLENMK